MRVHGPGPARPLAAAHLSVCPSVRGLPGPPGRLLHALWDVGSPPRALGHGVRPSSARPLPGSAPSGCRSRGVGGPGCLRGFCGQRGWPCLLCRCRKGRRPRPSWAAPSRACGSRESACGAALRCRRCVWSCALGQAGALTEKPALAPPVFVFQKDKGQKRSAGGSSPEGGEDSDREDGNYCPPVKRERTSSLTQLPLSQPEEKTSGFRLKPPTLIHGQAPSAGLPSQKPKEQQRSVLRPAVLQAPQPKALPQTVPSSGTNGVSILADCAGAAAASPDSPARRSPSERAEEARALEEKECQRNEAGRTLDEEGCEKREQAAQQAFVFGQNLRDRVKLVNESIDIADVDSAGQPSADTPAATNYFLQYISSSVENSTNSADCSSNKFVFGQNMSERVLSPPKLSEGSSEASREHAAAESGSEPSSQEATPEKESLAESAAAYTKATARKCLLEKVEVITGEEAESNVLQIQCKLFVFDKTSQSWVERGRGLLRLNDMASADDGTLQSRLVMRTQGSLRLILNTKLWAQMQIDKASEKSIRITAMDTEDQGVKVFLISASSKDTGQLYAALHHRILALRSRVEQEQEAKTPAPEPGAAPSHEEDDSDDDVLAPSGAAAAGAGDEGEGQTTGST
nr:ran-binding protein 3 isoform X4 [Oryctolagus cuniculus]